MHTPTTDHASLPEPGACQCRPWSLCARCARELQLFRHEAEIQQWLRSYGNVPDPGAPKR
jgi:hypothetical protein